MYDKNIELARKKRKNQDDYTKNNIHCIFYSAMIKKV